MKKITAKLTVKIEDTDNAKRTFKVVKHENGAISIGAGTNPDKPLVHIHGDDVEKLIATINAVVKSKLPTDL